MFKLKTNQRGFTLIELMVVMAVLATLSGIVIGGVTGVGTKGKETTIKSDQNTIQSAVDRFYSDSDPQLYPIASNNLTPTAGVYIASPTAVPDRTTANISPTTSVARVIDFKFPLWQDGVDQSVADANQKFVPKYLKAIPTSVDRVTWWIKFPQAEVFWTGDPSAADVGGAHPTNMK